MSEPKPTIDLQSRFLSKRLVLAIHRDLIDSFGGVHGLRDEAALESALAQPEATFGGRLLHPTIVEQAAAYLFHVCMAHPFLDGNKRTAFAAMDTFVRLKGYRLVLGDDEVYEITMAVARSDMGKNGVVSSIEANVVPG